MVVYIDIVYAMSSSWFSGTVSVDFFDFFFFLVQIFPSISSLLEHPCASGAVNMYYFVRNFLPAVYQFSFNYSLNKRRDSKVDQMRALGFQMGRRYQASPASATHQGLRKILQKIYVANRNRTHDFPNRI